jgi:hypothetical protein
MQGSKAVRALAAMLFVAVACAVVACFLPNSAYQRFQLLDGTIYQSLRWNYERIHFDPRPVDVAIVGPSTTALGLSAPRLEQDLAERGTPGKAVNFSIIADGRNIEWAIVNELYKTKSPKVIVVGVDQTQHRWGHPAFKYVAPAKAVAFPPAPFLHNYIYDVFFLPFRQIKLFAAWLMPDSFGLTKQFDPVRYANAPIDLTVSHRMEDGKWIDMDRSFSPSELMAQQKRVLGARKHSVVPRGLADLVEADNETYVREIARLAAAHGTRLVFVFVPVFNAPPVVEDRAFYERFGPIVDNGDLARNPELYEGWAHLNHAGAMVLTDRLAAAVAPYLTTGRLAAAERSRGPM